MKIKLAYLNQKLTLSKVEIIRLIEDDNHDIQSLQLSNNSLKNLIFKIEKTFVIKIIEDKSNKYESDFYINYLKFVKQMKLQFNQNDVKKRTKDSNRKKIDYVMTFLKNTIESNWDAEKQFNSRRIYIWKKFKDFHKINIDRIETLFEDSYNDWHDYDQKKTQNVKVYNEKRVKLIIYLSSTLKFTLEQKMNAFYSDLRKKVRKKLKYFLKFTKKIDFIAQVKRFENVDREKRLNTKKRKKRDKKFDNENNSKSKSKKFKDHDKKDHKSKLDKLDKSNFNRLSMSKKKRLFRWTWKKHQTIMKKKICLECDKSNHDVEECINKKKIKMSKILTFRSKNE